jgi:long-chain acyl-CoA synthetase
MQELETKASGWQRSLFDYALDRQLQSLDQGRLTQGGFVEKMAFGAVRQQFGGRLRLITCGAAPVDPNVLQFFRAVLGAHVLEGYGQTESIPVMTMSHIFDYTTPYGSHVGAPLPGCQIKLVTLDEYTAEDTPNPRGEIYVAGFAGAKGYYRNGIMDDIETDAGWIRTGDIGEWLPNGTMRVIDSRKAL